MPTLTYDNKDAVPADLAAFASERDGKFVVDVTPARTAAELRKQFEEQTTANQTAAAALEALRKEKADLEARLSSTGDEDAKVAARVKQFEEGQRAEKTQLQKRIEAAVKEANEAKAKHDAVLVRAELSDALNPISATINPQALPTLVGALARNIRVIDGRATVVDDNGEKRYASDATTPLSITAYVSEALDGPFSFTKRVNPGTNAGPGVGRKADPTKMSASEMIANAHPLFGKK